jgi:hypothetical protein
VNEKIHVHRVFFFSTPPKRGDLRAISGNFGQKNFGWVRHLAVKSQKIVRSAKKTETIKRSDDADLKKINTDFYYLRKSF